MTTYEGELRRFPSRTSDTAEGRQRFHAILDPHFPPVGAQAVTREISATGADGEMVGILRYTGRPFRFVGIIGVATEMAAEVVERWLNEIDGRVGEVEIVRGGRRKVLAVQVAGAARTVRAQYITASDVWALHVRYVATMREVL